jgi:hypothetical protein
VGRERANVKALHDIHSDRQTDRKRKKKKKKKKTVMGRCLLRHIKGGVDRYSRL